MALAVNHPRGARVHTARRGTAEEPRVYERQVGAAFIGLLAIVAGAWGALAGYIGPYFDFRPVAHDTWVASLQNGLLHLLPGAVAVAAGFMLLVMGPARRTVRGGAFLLPALLLLASGAWFVIGPIAWPVFESSSPFVVGVTSTRNLLNVACASFAPGLVLVMLGGMALKAGMVPGVAVEDPYTPAEAGRADAAPMVDQAEPTAAPMAAAPVTGRQAEREVGRETGMPADERGTAPAAAEGATVPRTAEGGTVPAGEWGATPGTREPMAAPTTERPTSVSETEAARMRNPADPEGQA